jgi:hypothetical protein
LDAADGGSVLSSDTYGTPSLPHPLPFLNSNQNNTMGFTDFFKDLFYKQKPKSPPDYKGVGRVYLKPDRLRWQRVHDLFLLEKAYPDLIEVNEKGKRFICGGVLDGKNIPNPKNRQDEDALALYIENLDDWEFQFKAVSDIPGGMIVKAQDVTLKKTDFINIGEDAVSTPKLSRLKDNYCGLIVTQCNFYNGHEDDGSDKALQLNNAHGCVVDRCFFTGGITAMRMQDSSVPYTAKAEIVSCKFHHCHVAININGKSQVRVSNCKYENVKTQIRKGSKVKILK